MVYDGELEEYWAQKNQRFTWCGWLKSKLKSAALAAAKRLLSERMLAILAGAVAGGAAGCSCGPPGMALGAVGGGAYGFLVTSPSYKKGKHSPLALEYPDFFDSD
eukprot:3830534-Amphidinium_carterae.1